MTRRLGRWSALRQAGTIVPVTLQVSGIDIQLLVVGGRRPGPTFTVIAGVHGDEYEGLMAIARLLPTLPIESVSGTLLAVPVANPPAFEAGTRSSPMDGLNLARCFPGSRKGSPSMQLAALIADEVIAPADALIDLHIGGIASEMALLIGYCDGGDTVGASSRDLAVAFGAPVLWKHPEIAPGRTLSAAVALGIPSVYTEAGGGGGAPKDVVRCYCEGIARVMRAMNMLPDPRPQPRYHVRWLGSGNTDTAVSAQVPGLFRSLIGVGEDVSVGSVIGQILDYDGRIRERVTVNQDGVVAMVRRVPKVSVGDSLYLLTQRMDGR